MNEENNKTEAQQAREDLYEVKRFLSKKEWILDSKEIPTGDLTLAEQMLIEKLQNKEPLTDDELDQVEEILGRYRSAMNELKPTETLENVEKNIIYVQDEKTLLKLLDEEEEIETVTMYYPLNKDKEVKIQIDIKPLKDSQAILDLQSNLSMFTDTTITQEENTIYQRSIRGEELTPEEQQMAQMVAEKVNEQTSGHEMEIVYQFLSYQTTLHGQDNTPEQMRQLYEKMDFMYVIQLFNEVQGKINLSNVDVDRVFRQSD